MASLFADRKLGNISKWMDRHDAIVRRNIQSIQGALEVSDHLILQLRSWQRYADNHFARFGSYIGEDYVLGPAWEQIGTGIRTLLNGESGNLDCGTLDAFILDTLKENGIDTENL